MHRDVARVTWIATVQLGVSIAIMAVVFVQQRGFTEASGYTLPAEWAIVGACAFFLIGIALGGLLSVSPTSHPGQQAQEAPAEPAVPSPEALLDIAAPSDAQAFSVLLSHLDQSVGIRAAMLSTRDGLVVCHTIPRPDEASAAGAFVEELVREATRWRKDRGDELRRIEIATGARSLWVFAGKGLILSVLVNANGRQGHERARQYAEAVGVACDRIWAQRYGAA